jgi:hypothetical protein
VEEDADDENACHFIWTSWKKTELIKSISKAMKVKKNP